MAALSPPDGFHHCQFCLVRDTPCPAAPSGQPFDLEYVAHTSSSSTSTGALEWMPQGILGLDNPTLFKGFSVQSDVGYEDKPKARPLVKAQPTQQGASGVELRFARIQRRSEVEVHTQHHVMHKWVSQSHVRTSSWSCSWSGVTVGFLSGYDGNCLRWTNVTDKRPHFWVETRYWNGWTLNTRVSDSGDSVPKNESQTRETASPAQSTWSIERGWIVECVWKFSIASPVITQRCRTLMAASEAAQPT